MIQLMLHQVPISTCLYPTGLTSKKLKDILKVNFQTESESENIIAPGASNHLDWKVFGRRKPFKCRWLRFTQKRPISISAVMRYICKKKLASYGGDDDVKAKSAYPLMLVMMMMMMKMMMSMLVQMFLFF